MRIYIFADQESVAGVFSRSEKYLFASEYATLELCAICEALLSRGVEGILINSLHTLEYDRLPEGVKVFHGLPTHHLFTEGIESGFDAAFIVGMHEMAGGSERGCWRHTILPHPISHAYSSVEAVWLNDRRVGETGLFAAFAGTHNIPVVLLTGDHWACLEAEELIPGLETVAVKEGRSYFSAISMTPSAAAKAAADGAARALGKVGTIKPWKIDGPVTLTVRYQFAERATDAVGAVPGARRVDERTVAVSYPSLAELGDNLGEIRAPETLTYAADMRQPRATGPFTRLGSEPYVSAPTFPLPAR